MRIGAREVEIKRSAFAIEAIVFGLIGAVFVGLLVPTLFVWMSFGRHTFPELFQSFAATVSTLTGQIGANLIHEPEEMIVLVPFVPSVLVGAFLGVIVAVRRRRMRP